MNMKMNIQAAEQKNKISGLVQELKMEQLCGQSTLKRKEEAILGRDKMHSAETARLKRELENLQKIVSKGPGSPFEEKQKVESASFRRGTRLNRKNGLGNRLSGSVQHSSISRSTSTENISISGSTQASSEEEWPNSIVNSARTETRQRQSNIQRGRRPKLRKGRPPPISTTPGTVSDLGSRNSLARFPPKSTPNSSLAAAAAGGGNRNRFSPQSEGSRGPSPGPTKNIDAGSRHNSYSSLAMAANKGKKK